MVSNHIIHTRNVSFALPGLFNKELEIKSYLEIFVAKKGIKDILIQKGKIGTKFLSYQMGPIDMFRQINDSAAINELRNRHGISENDYIVACYWQF